MAGELDLTVNEGTEQIRGVTRVKPHPNYDGEDYNIAVLTVMNLLKKKKNNKKLRIVDYNIS